MAKPIVAKPEAPPPPTEVPLNTNVFTKAKPPSPKAAFSPDRWEPKEKFSAPPPPPEDPPAAGFGF